MFTGIEHVKIITKSNNMPLTGDNSTIVTSKQITVQIPNY